MRKLVLILVMGSLLSGCSNVSTSSSVGPNNKQTKEVVTAVEKDSRKRKLFALAKDRTKRAADTHAVYQQNPQPFRKALLRKNLTQGLALVKKLLAHPDLADEEIEAVLGLKAELLFYGATNFAPECVEELRGMARTALTAASGSKYCHETVIRWFRIKFADPEFDVEEAGVAWLNLARVYPDSEEASETLSQLAIQMIEKGKVKESQSLITNGEKILNAPNFDHAKSQLKELKTKYQSAHVALVANKRQRFRDKVLAKTNGRKSGCFVLYSKEKRGNDFNYAVHRGFDGVLMYAAKAERKNWNWKMVKNFPDNQAGFERAVEHKNKLVRENAVSFKHFTAD